jgi:hypothetical protein
LSKRSRNPRASATKRRNKNNGTRAAASRIEVTSANDTSRFGSNPKRLSKQAAEEVKQSFKAAVKEITPRDEEAPQPTRRRRGEKESGRPAVRIGLTTRHIPRLTARRRYQSLQPLPAIDTHDGFTKAAEVVCNIAEAVAGMFEDMRKALEKALLGDDLYLSDALAALHHWNDEALAETFDDHHPTSHNYVSLNN